MPALGALQGGGIAATVDEQDRLFPPFQPVVHRFGQTPRNCGYSPMAGGLDAQVDDFDPGQLALINAVGQLQQPILPGLGVGKTLQGRRGRAQQADGAGQLRPHDRDIPAMIARHFVLLVSRLVFFIHHDQPEIFHRCEHRRTGSHHHPRLPGCKRQPAVKALPFA